MGEASRKKHLLITAVLILVLAPCAFSQLYGCFLERETSAYLAAVNARWQLELPTTVERVLYAADHGGQHCYILTFAERPSDQPWELVSDAEARASVTGLTVAQQIPSRWQPDGASLLPVRIMTRTKAPDQSLHLIYFDRLPLAGSSYQHVLYLVESGS